MFGKQNINQIFLLYNKKSLTFWKFPLATELEWKREKNCDKVSAPPPGRLFWREHQAAPADGRAAAPAVGQEHRRPRRHWPAVVLHETGCVPGPGRHILCVYLGPPGERFGSCRQTARLSGQVSLMKLRMSPPRWFFAEASLMVFLTWFMYKATTL